MRSKVQRFSISDWPVVGLCSGSALVCRSCSITELNTVSTPLVVASGPALLTNWKRQSCPIWGGTRWMLPRVTTLRRHRARTLLLRALVRRPLVGTRHRRQCNASAFADVGDPWPAVPGSRRERSIVQPSSILRSPVMLDSPCCRTGWARCPELTQRAVNSNRAKARRRRNRPMSRVYL